MNLYPEAINSKLPNTGLSIFAVMSAMANKYSAINLSQGFPDFKSCPKLIELVHNYMKKGFNQYAPMPGLMSLREAISEKTEYLYNAVYNPDTEITVTAGAKQGIYTAISAFVKEDDEVIVFEPAYDSYVPTIKLNGGTPICVHLKMPDYKVDWNEVRKLLNRRTKMIIINTPHNPTGTILKEDDMKELERITKNTGIIILSDEVYEHIIFDNHNHQSVCRYPALAERSLVLSSFGKTFHNTGWKIGYCVAPSNLMKEFRKVHQFIVFCVNSPIQYALADYIKDKSNYENLGEFYQKKRDYFLKLVEGSRFKKTPSLGTYFQSLDYSKISEEDEMPFAEKLIKEHGIGSVPISSFYNKPINNKILRFCFAKSDETLEKAAEILCKI